MPKSHAMPAHRAFPLDWASVNRAAFTHASPISWVWVFVIACDFFFLANPVLLFTFEADMRISSALTMIALVFTPRRHLPKPPLALTAMLALGLFSATWSWFARLTIDFSAIYFAIAAMGLIIASTVDARTLAFGALLGGVAITMCSVIMWQMNVPGVGIPPGSEGILAGVGANRNILSYSLVVPLAFAIGCFPRGRVERTLWLLGVGIVLLGIVLAESGTGYLVTGVLVAAALTMGAIDRWHPPRPAGSPRRAGLRAGAFAAVAGGGVLALTWIGNELGRDFTSLSGRVPLWEAIWNASTGSIRWIGEGWGSVWPHPWYQAPTNDTYLRISEPVSVYYSHGHNSIFDILPELGILGVVAIAGVYVQAVARGLSLRRPDTEQPSQRRLEASRMTLLGVIALSLLGLTEPMSVIPLGWFAIAILSSGIAVGAREASTEGSRSAH